MKKIVKIAAVTFLLILLVIGGLFLIYVGDYEKANQDAVYALSSSEDVEVIDNDDYIIFTPKETYSIGLIFYPGGKVEPSVYSRLFNALAKKGIKTIVVKMPFNLAMFNINGADGIVDNNPDVTTWFMGGHSLGGVFATEYLKDHLDIYDGMIYLASYANSDISTSELRVLSITASLDTVLNIDGYENAKSLLPSDTYFYEIIGGNHSQFGDYGLQKGDTKATISTEEQHHLILQEIMKFIDFKQ